MRRTCLCSPWAISGRVQPCPVRISFWTQHLHVFTTILQSHFQCLADLEPESKIDRTIILSNIFLAIRSHHIYSGSARFEWLSLGMKSFKGSPFTPTFRFRWVLLFLVHLSRCLGLQPFPGELPTSASSSASSGSPDAFRQFSVASTTPAIGQWNGRHDLQSPALFKVKSSENSAKKVPLFQKHIFLMSILIHSN